MVNDIGLIIVAFSINIKPTL